MKNIIKSLVIVVAVAAVASVATWAVFLSTATVDNNTFSTGILEIRVDGQAVKTGFNATNMVPGDCKTGSHTLMNYGAPHFGGPSTLAAKEISVNVADLAGNSPLKDSLTLAMYANAGWGGCSGPGVTWVPGKGCRIYNDVLLGSVTEQDVLHYTQWGTQATLAAGSSITINYDVCLPLAAGNDVQGQTATFDFVFTGYNPHH